MVNRANSDVGPVLILAGIITDTALVLSFLQYHGKRNNGKQFQTVGFGTQMFVFRLVSLLCLL